MKRGLESKLGKNRDVHFNNKLQLHDKIQQSTQNVNELQKHSQMNMIASNQAAAGTGNPMGMSTKAEKKKEAEGEVNLEELLNDISRDILRIYKHTFNPQADVHTRNPLDLLTVIFHSLFPHFRR